MKNIIIPSERELNIIDVFKNIGNGKYTKKEILKCLSYLENNDRKMLDEVAKLYLPRYYNENSECGYKFMAITFCLENKLHYRNGK